MAPETALAERFATAQAVAREAGALGLDYFRRFTELEVRSKGLQDAVSEADIAVDALICERLTKAFPGDGLLSEEGGPPRVSDAGTWVVDPIDGTACFVAGIPTWCVSIAYVRGKEVPIGVIYDPNQDEIFAACRGAGATLNGQPLQPSPAETFEAGMVGVGYSTRTPPAAALGFLEQLFDTGGMFACSGSGALMIAYVAAGRLLGYFEAHMQPWDGAAGVALVREAGGWSNDFLAGEGLTKGNLIAVSGARLAPAMRALAGLD